MSELMIGKTSSGAKLPVLVDNTGKLQIGGVQLDNLNVNTDQIEGKQDVTNAILTTTAADIAAVKTQLATGSIAVTGGGGGGGGGASAAYNATLPTYTSGASSTLQTDANGRLITLANNAVGEEYTYTATGAVALNSVIVGPIECSQFREISVQASVLGTGSQLNPQISNNGSVWVNAHYVNSFGTVNVLAINNTAVYNYQLLGARYFRIIQAVAQTAGTTTLVAYASQQATPKLYQSVTLSANNPAPIPAVNAGFSTYHSLVAAATANATSVKGSGGTIGTLILTNTSATWAYFKLVNKGSAPAVGTDTAVINIGVAPNSTQDCSTAFAGLRMNLGIAYYVSAGTSLTDNTALPAAGTFLVNMTYV
jgi:hypothetical protein